MQIVVSKSEDQTVHCSDSESRFEKKKQCMTLVVNHFFLCTSRKAENEILLCVYTLYTTNNKLTQSMNRVSKMVQDSLS